MLDIFQSAGPWVMTALFAIVAVWCRLDAGAARAERDAMASKALTERDKLREQLAKQTWAIDVAWKGLEPVSLRARADAVTTACAKRMNE